MERDPFCHCCLVLPLASLFFSSSRPEAVHEAAPAGPVAQGLPLDPLSVTIK